GAEALALEDQQEGAARGLASRLAGVDLGVDQVAGMRRLQRVVVGVAHRELAAREEPHDRDTQADGGDGQHQPSKAVDEVAPGVEHAVTFSSPMWRAYGRFMSTS